MDDPALFWDVVNQRRSIRKFKPEAVPDEFIERILQTGVKAPNANNRQSWRFLVFREPQDILTLADTLNINYRRDLLAAGRDVAMVEQKLADRKVRICGGKVIIVMFVDTADLKGYSEAEPADPGYLMAVQSAALAGGQMLLAGQALGLGGFWMGGPLHAQQILKDTFNLPASWLAQGMLVFGYPDDDSEKRSRRPMGDVVRYFKE